MVLFKKTQTFTYNQPFNDYLMNQRRAKTYLHVFHIQVKYFNLNLIKIDKRLKYFKMSN